MIMEKEWDLLVVSSRLANRKALLHILDGLPVDVFTAATVRQAHEVLSRHPVRLVFCEEHFADGSYRDVLKTIHAEYPGLRLVLMLCTGEWEEYLEALRLGATEVIRCPLQPTDVELALIRAARETRASEAPTPFEEAGGAHYHYARPS
jgi:DNA-binding NtrC family response regulator